MQEDLKEFIAFPFIVKKKEKKKPHVKSAHFKILLQKTAIVHDT